jgi:arabinogalactan endo-1,4-beta-galactosidase
MTDAGSSSSSSSGSSSGARVDAGSSGSGIDAGARDSGGPHTQPFNPSFMLGADITWTQQDAAGGATYVDNGTTKPILQLLADHGINFIRLRTFVDPTQPAPNPAGGTFAPYSTAGFGDITHTIAYGQQIKAAGMGFLLDFHYSDTWADPGKQVKPLAWVNDNLAAAVTHLHDYTLASIQALVAAGARPDMVQIGNEITTGILTSPGTALGPTSTWPGLAQLLNAGITAVHEVDPTIKIMIHLDRGGDLASSVAFIDNAMRANPPVVFDVFGESCYVAFQGGPAACGPVLTSLATMFPTLKLAVAEYNGDLAPNQADTEIRQANQIDFDLDMLGRQQGAGAFFWEPTRTPNAQNPGMFTVNGRVYTAIPGCLSQFDQMKLDYGL